MSANSLGRYQIIREIARSNDVVYEAVDTSINRRVALKELLLPPNLTGAQKRERVERFYREARAAGSLAHPNIVTIFEAGEDHGRHFIAMEYLEGQTLRNALDIEGKLPVESAVDIATQVCQGLSYAHSKGVVHRDIKPDNVQILPGGHIKITDFGIARLMEEPSITADGQVFGTPSYMSPEQVAGKQLDARTDLFSLGVMLYEMLVGKKPFTGDTVVTITYNIMNHDISVPPTVPAYLERVLKRCMAKDPNLRYSSATELIGDLDPNSFQGMPSAPQPDPFGATMGVPASPYNGQVVSPQPPPIHSLPKDPFANLKPGDLSLPRPSPKPMLSPDSSYFLKVFFTVVIVCAFVIGFIWLLSAGYQGYQKRGRSEEVNIHLDAGTKHFESQSYQAAIEEYSKALKLSADPEVNKLARRNIAVAYIQLGIEAEHAGNPIQGVSYYKQAIVYYETSADAYLFLGNALANLHHDDQALAAWDKAIQYDGAGKVGMAAREATAAMYHERGDAAYRSGDTSAAVQWWRKAVEAAPGTSAGDMAQQKIDRFGGG